MGHRLRFGAKRATFPKTFSLNTIIRVVPTHSIGPTKAAASPVENPYLASARTPLGLITKSASIQTWIIVLVCLILWICGQCLPNHLEPAVQRAVKSPLPRALRAAAPQQQHQQLPRLHVLQQAEQQLSCVVCTWAAPPLMAMTTSPCCPPRPVPLLTAQAALLA